MNCRPGDLAIAFDTSVPENEGRIVRVIYRHINTADWNYTGIAAWWCESELPMIWHFDRSGRVVESCEGPIPDRNLRPVRPPTDGAEQRHRHGVDRDPVDETR